MIEVGTLLSSETMKHFLFIMAYELKENKLISIIDLRDDAHITRHIKEPLSNNVCLSCGGIIVATLYVVTPYH